jgi:hypothetical protein
LWSSNPHCLIGTLACGRATNANGAVAAAHVVAAHVVLGVVRAAPFPAIVTLDKTGSFLSSCGPHLTANIFLHGCSTAHACSNAWATCEKQRATLHENLLMCTGSHIRGPHADGQSNLRSYCCSGADPTRVSSFCSFLSCFCFVFVPSQPTRTCGSVGHLCMHRYAPLYWSPVHAPMCSGLLARTHSKQEEIPLESLAFRAL